MGAFLPPPVLAPAAISPSVPKPRGDAPSAAARISGIPTESIHHSRTFVRDAVRGMKVYPANYFRSLSAGRS